MRELQIVLVVLLCASAQSQPPTPTPTPTKDTRGKQQNRSAKEQQVDSRNDKTNPGVTVVNEFYPQPDSREKEESKDNKQKGTPTDTLIAISTSLLAVFTLLLAG